MNLGGDGRDESPYPQSIRNSALNTPSGINTRFNSYDNLLPLNNNSRTGSRHADSDDITILSRPVPAYTRNHSSFATFDSENSRITSSATLIAEESASPYGKENNSDYGFQSTISFDRKGVDESYMVEKLHERDDAEHLGPWKRRFWRLSPLFTIIAMVAYVLYFTYRIYCTVTTQAAYNQIYPMAWVFIAAEAGVTAPAMLHQFYSLLSIKGRKRAKLRLRGDIAPTVDVMITCCKEDVDVVLDTVRATVCVDYPRDRFRVIVLDDGADAELKAAVENLQMVHKNLYYHARIKIKGQPHHAKAGNLIGGTEFSNNLPGGPAEYIAALDADMIPQPEWLRAIIAHLACDPQLGLACPPQLFYNVPDNDPLVQSLDPFVHVMEPNKDLAGVAWCTGSGYALRRAALDSIGGWPLGTIAEDTLTSAMLLGAGWKTAYVHEPLQYGTVPDTYGGHIKQRTRWTLGTLQNAVKLRACLWGPAVRKMTFLQRVSGVVFSIDAFSKIFVAIAPLIIPIVLISRGTLVAYHTMDQLRWQLRLCFAWLIASRIDTYILFLPSGYRQTQRDGDYMIWSGPYHALTVFRSFILPKSLGGKTLAFTSSGSLKDELHERDPKHRAGLFRRLKVIVWDCGAWMHVFYIIFTLAAVGYSTYYVKDEGSTYDKFKYLLTHAFFPPLFWVIVVVAFMVPIRYAIFPPSMPDREELLDRDEKTQIAYPKPRWTKQRWGKRTWCAELQVSALTAYTVLVFAATIII